MVSYLSPFNVSQIDLSFSGQISYNSAQERLELERVTSRAIELESRCRQLESALAIRDSEQRRLDEVFKCKVSDLIVSID